MEQLPAPLNLEVVGPVLDRLSSSPLAPTTPPMAPLFPPLQDGGESSLARSGRSGACMDIPGQRRDAMLSSPQKSQYQSDAPASSATDDSVGIFTRASPDLVKLGRKVTWVLYKHPICIQEPRELTHSGLRALVEELCSTQSAIESLNNKSWKQGTLPYHEDAWEVKVEMPKRIRNLCLSMQLSLSGTDLTTTALLQAQKSGEPSNNSVWRVYNVALRYITQSSNLLCFVQYKLSDAKYTAILDITQPFSEHHQSKFRVPKTRCCSVQ